jgi:hypothetical protein
MGSSVTAEEEALTGTVEGAARFCTGVVRLAIFVVVV